MSHIRWTSREFLFDLPVENFPFILERLRGTKARIAELVSGLSNDQLTKKVNAAWSIQEHVGHLIDLDELHDGRIDDFIRGLPELRAADMTNKKTYEADHNKRNISELVNEFGKKRETFISRLAKLDPSLASHHPRLHKTMRVVDMAFFVAEHDDHHLFLMRELI
ncbi:MAG TPA: DinB family protein [Bacteroidia bacterium]|jgi:hypothetical protein|nr:DinB family protein [Bacteroidia bacterium]